MLTPLAQPILVDSDKLVAGALRPNRHHTSVRALDDAEAHPISGFAPDDPILQPLGNQTAVFNLNDRTRVIAPAGVSMTFPLCPGT